MSLEATPEAYSKVSILGLTVPNLQTGKEAGTLSSEKAPIHIAYDNTALSGCILAVLGLRECLYTTWLLIHSQAHCHLIHKLLNPRF